MARPRPLPCSGDLVVKNGSSARSRTSAGMPPPSSLTASRANHPRQPATSAAPRPPSSQRPSSIRSEPPSGMASRALVARLSRICSTAATSALTRGSAGSQTTSISIDSGSSRRRISPILSTAPVRSIALRVSGDLRLRVSRFRISRAPRSAAPCTSAISSWSGSSPGGRAAAISSTLPRITVSRLLKSCATPPLNWPMASNRCA